MDDGAKEDDFIKVALDRKADMKYRNPNILYDHILECTKDATRRFYVFIDEVQLAQKYW